MGLSWLLALLFTLSLAESTGMPCPFTRTLSLQTPPLQGKDVTILQTLIKRAPSASGILVTGKYDAQTQNAVESFQRDNSIPVTGNVDSLTATTVLQKLSYDNYRDDHTMPAWAKYKVHVPVHKDR